MTAAKNNSSALPLVWEIGEELKLWWRTQPDKLLFFLVLVPWVALFQFWGNSTFGFKKTPSLFGWMYFIFQTSVDDQFCLVVPLFVLGLFYWKRDELMAVPKHNWWPAIFLLGLGLSTHIVGYLVQQTRISIIGFFVGLYGLTGLVWGRQWLRASFFPMFLFGFCVPLGTLADTFTLPLRILVTKVAVGIGHLGLGIDVSAAGSQIINGQGVAMYDVAPACSGIRSLTALLALAMVYAFLCFNRPWKRALIILTAVPVALAGNVARVSVVIMVGEVFGHDAGAMVEQKFGFLTFGVALVCLLILGRSLRERGKEPQAALKERPA